MADSNYARMRVGSSSIAVESSFPRVHPRPSPISCSAGTRAKRCRGVAARYRDRAYECLSRARVARSNGDLKLAAGYLSEVQAWTEFASSWVARAVAVEEQEPEDESHE
jgi:hypothetical protein